MTCAPDPFEFHSIGAVVSMQKYYNVVFWKVIRVYEREDFSLEEFRTYPEQTTEFKPALTTVMTI